MKVIGYALWLICAVSCGSSGQTRNEFRVDRERVLGYDMRLSPIGPYYSGPYDKSAGVIWTQSVIHPLSVAGIRVHIKIVQNGVAANWKITFRDLAKREIVGFDSTSPFARAGEAWSQEIPGNGALVELWSDSDPAGLQIVIDKYAYRTQPTFPEAIWGTDDRLPIRSVSTLIQKWGTAVARLRIMVPQGEALCTGFLVANDLLLTNHHCIKEKSEALSTVAEFGYDEPGSTPDKFTGRVLELTNEDLDYSLLRLSGIPGNQYAHADLAGASDVTEKQGLVIIEHPGGEPKQASIKDCEISGANRSGTGTGLTDFGHHCDTLGGSSGSPVFDFRTGQVVGLHHLGFTTMSTSAVNQAVKMSLVLQDIRERSRSLYQELRIRQ